MFLFPEFQIHPMNSKLKIGVLGSGKGSNYEAIQEAINAGTLQAETRIVFSDVEDSGILKLAHGYGVSAMHVPGGKFKTLLEPETELKVVQILKFKGVELVVLAGYMRMLKDPLLKAFPHRIINIHPSLLPKYPGLEAWKQALAAGEKKTGCTVHYVDEGMDTGEIIAQSEVPILRGDTPKILHARIQEAEHRLYPEVIALLAADLAE